MFKFFKKKKNPIKAVEIPPTEDFSNVDIIAEYFYQETGITFENQMSILQSKLSSFCRQRDIHSFTQLLQSVHSQENIKQELIDYLTTNETFFYREIKQINELVALVKEKDTDVKILCAPSATGEEPYSIAISLLEAGISSTSFTIMGIDINSDAIIKAQEAVYSEKNVRNLSNEIRTKYFIRNGGNFELKHNIKSLVTFQCSNIFDDNFKQLGKFDFVFSRNMLIYFDKPTKLKAKKILEDMRKTDKHKVFFGHADLF